MVNVVAITNPLDPAASRVCCRMIGGMPLDHYVSAMIPGFMGHYDIAVGLDGRLVNADELAFVDDGCTLSLVVVPRGGGSGKNIARLVGMIVLAVASIKVGGLAAGLYSAGAQTTMGVAMAHGGGVMYAAAGAAIATQMVGSMLISALLPLNTAMASSRQQPSATYSWDISNNSVLEGGALPALYGKSRIIPPRIGGYVEGSGDKQSMHLLFAVAGHKVDSITGIQINDTGIENYSETTYETRLGTNNQQIIQAFGDTRTVVSGGSMPVELSTDWTTITTQGNAMSCIGFGIWFPSGLGVMNGNVVGAVTVDILIEYKLSTDTVWTQYMASTSEPVVTVADYWSAGYWMDTSLAGLMWIELEQGSTNHGAHTEGEKYEADPSVWLNTQYAHEEYEKPVTIWRWVTSGNYILAAGSDVSYFSIREARTTPLRYVRYTPNGLPAGQYNLRMKRRTAKPELTEIEYFTSCYWEYYTEVIEDDFVYPNTAVLSIHAIATNKLSGGIPRVSALVERSKVWVYDPGASEYVEKSASNPAWACYDVLHGARKLVDINAAGYDSNDELTWSYVFIQQGAVPHNRIMYADFAAWAAWCDDIAGGKGAYSCNIYIDNTDNVRKALDMIGVLGRGCVVPVGTYFSCVVERTEILPVQRFLFNVANILQDSYSEEWHPLDERANAIEITYYDKDQDYKSANLEIYQSGFDESTEQIKKASVDLRGCTDRAMAAAFGKFLLNCNRYITMTASWIADVDAIACMPGDIIEVQHDVPQYGYGGRLLGNCTTATLYLDTAVVMESGKQYWVIINHQSDDLREEVQVTLSVGTTSTINLSTPLSRAPSADTRYTFGEAGKLCKLMRVIKVTRSSEQRRKITAVEFVNAVYDDTVTTILPGSPSDLPRQMFPPPLAAVTISIAWKFDNAAKTWAPYVRMEFHYDPDTDYVNIAIPISKTRVWVHAEAGDTSSAPLKSNYEIMFDCAGGTFDILAAELTGKTLYVTASLVNQRGYESTKCGNAVFYVNTSYTVDATSNVSIDGYNYTNNGPNGYTVYFSWAPYGWALSGGKYTPILTWNDGTNYHVFDKYLVGYGIVENTGDIPAPAAMMYYQTPDIGNIYASNGTMITDVDDLDAICRAAASSQLQLNYTYSWVAISVAPMTKNGAVAALDFSQADYGLDWEWIQVKWPGGANNNVTDNQIQNAELVYTMQPGSVFLNEINWDYALQSPYIDGFAIIYRLQGYHWQWPLNSSILSGETNINTILAAVNFAAGGGSEAMTDFSDRYLEWYAGGIQYFYMMFVNETQHEIVKITTQTLAVERGAEGTTAKAWASGALLSYMPCELIDSIVWLPDASQRSYVFNPPAEINMVLYCAITAVKLVVADDSPGYVRSHLAVCDTVRGR